MKIALQSGPHATGDKIGSVASASDTAQNHLVEIKKGARFEFGKNWTRFLRHLTLERIEAAQHSLQDFLAVDRLDGKSFLDIGNGSGLFSLAARRLGARVHSFDYDPNSVACARELRRRFFPDDPDWTIEQASALDEAYLGSLGQFDIVYSWGVLHHTGAMYRALDNVKPLVPLGGKLFIAIYNDLGGETDEWERIKRRYNALPRGLRLLYALKLIARMEGPAARAALRAGRFGQWLESLRNYGKNSARGMSRWHDYIDWVGGYPYERAKVHEIVDFYARDGFRLDRLHDRSAGIGCNQFVFERTAPAGVYVESAVPGGHSMAWRFGRRVVGPFERDAQGEWTGIVANPPDRSHGTALYLFRDDCCLGHVELGADNRVRVAAATEDRAHTQASALHVVAALQRPLTPPFKQVRGLMWEASAPELLEVADRAEAPRRSAGFVFEDGRQLPRSHVRHDEIAEKGEGRFSHWRSAFYFSTTDNSDPNANGRAYVVLVGDEPLPAERSVAHRYGVALLGPFEATASGWVAIVPLDGPEGDLYLIRDGMLVGPAVRDAVGRVVVAAVGEAETHVNASRFHVVVGQVEILAGPFQHRSGHMWSQPMPHLAALADTAEAPTRSPAFLFENGRQLPYPHTGHKIIAEFGGGRFSHWGTTLYFSTLAGEDPNVIRELALLTPTLPPS